MAEPNKTTSTGLNSAIQIGCEKVHPDILLHFSIKIVPKLLEMGVSTTSYSTLPLPLLGHHRARKNLHEAREQQ